MNDRKRIVAVAAHPDDETAFAGGMLARYAAEGNEVWIVAVTRGEGGEVGDPPLCGEAELGVIREAELRAAAAALGARDVVFLGFVDPRIPVGAEGRPIDATLAELAAALHAALARLQPDIVLSHGSNGEYGHPQHIFTHQAVRSVLDQWTGSPPPTLLTWCATHPGQENERLMNRDDPADLIVDVTPWLERKLAALACHQTQLAMIRRNSKEQDLEKIVLRMESFRRW